MFDRFAAPAVILTFSLVACATQMSPVEGVSSVEALAGPVSFPESGVWDAASGVWFVSNFGQAFDPSGGTADAPGFISRIDAEGNVLQARLVESDGDFLGLALMDGLLYASRGSEIWQIDPSTGNHTVIEVPGAGFLNDVAAGDGVLYVTDTARGAIHRIVPGRTPEVFSEAPELQAPNGVTVDGDTVVVVTLGAFPPDPSRPGAIFTLDAQGRATRLGTTSGLFDGVEKVRDAYVVSDITGPLWRIDTSGEARQLGDLTALGLGSANDFGVDEESLTLLVADLGSNRLWRVFLYGGFAVSSRSTRGSPSVPALLARRGRPNRRGRHGYAVELRPSRSSSSARATPCRSGPGPGAPLHRGPNQLLRR